MLNVAIHPSGSDQYTFVFVSFREGWMDLLNRLDEQRSVYTVLGHRVSCVLYLALPRQLQRD